MTCKKRLSDNLGISLSDSFAQMAKVRFYYWNIKGNNYYSTKQMLKSHHEEMSSIVDKVATAVFLNGYTYCKAGFREMADNTCIKDADATQSIECIITDLVDSYRLLIISLEKVQLLAIEQGDYSVNHVSNECIITCKKHVYELNASR